MNKFEKITKAVLQITMKFEKHRKEDNMNLDIEDKKNLEILLDGYYDFICVNKYQLDIMNKLIGTRKEIMNKNDFTEEDYVKLFNFLIEENDLLKRENSKLKKNYDKILELLNSK